jgi:hypothetical protein
MRVIAEGAEEDMQSVDSTTGQSFGEAQMTLEASTTTLGLSRRTAAGVVQPEEVVRSRFDRSRLVSCHDGLSGVRGAVRKD